MLNSFRWLGKHQLEFPHLTPRYLLQDLFTNLLPDCQEKLVLKPIHHLHFHDFEGRVLICKLLLLLIIQKFGRLSSYLLSLIVFPSQGGSFGILPPWQFRCHFQSMWAKKILPTPITLSC